MKDATNHSREIQIIENLAVFLDSKYKAPFGISFGYDFIVGLIPVVGNILTTMVSFYIIYVSFKLGCSKTTVLKMIFNLVVENTASMVPFLGNVFDLYWKANNKNIQLLKKSIP